MIYLSARSVGELGPILDHVHDRWFELDGVSFDKQTGVVTIPFSKDGARLMINQATGLRIEDSERIGAYDFNSLRYEPGQNRLTVLTGVPLTLEASVDAFNVTLEIDGEPATPSPDQTTHVLP